MDFRGYSYRINVTRSLDAPLISSRGSDVELWLPARGEYVIAGTEVMMIEENAAVALATCILTVLRWVQSGLFRGPSRS